jgi:hypothetical protein
MTTIGESISRIRNTTKTISQDAFITDRLIYSIIIKYAKLFIKKEELLNMRLKFSSLFKPITMDLVEVDKTDSCCSSITTKIKIMRTEDKIPQVFEGKYGQFIRTVSSIDGYNEVYRTTPAAYSSLSKTSNFKYNKTLYYWYQNGYLYFPNIDWEQIKIEGIFEKNMSVFACEENEICSNPRERDFLIPDDLFAEIEKQVYQDLGFLMQVPSDQIVSDKQNITR